MEKFFRKYGWAITLLIIGLMCLLLALNVNAFIASKLVKHTVPTLPNLQTAQKNANKNTRRTPARATNMATTIEKRCLFGCSEEKTPKTCPEGCADGEVCQEGKCVPAPNQAEDIDTASGPIASNLGVKLLGVMVAKPNRYSSALLKETTNKQTIILNVGDMLLGEGELIEVLRDRILIKRNGRIEYIKLENSITAASASKAKTVSRPSPSQPFLRGTGPKFKPNVPGGLNKTNRTSAGNSAGSNGSVKKLANNNYQINRAAMNKALKNPSQLSKGATVVPNFKNGQRNGVKLLTVTSNSVFNSLGMKKGDIVTRINGTSIRSQAHAVELLQSYKNKSNMYIEVNRDGSRQKLKYSVK